MIILKINNIKMKQNHYEYFEYFKIIYIIYETNKLIIKTRYVKYKIIEMQEYC